MAKQPLKTLARLLGASALLFLYAIGSTQTGYLHQLFHPEEISATHSVAQEQDPCHRSLYHGVDTGCRHEFHLAKMQSCGFCHTLVHADQIVFDTSTAVMSLSGTKPDVRIKGREAIFVGYTRLTRGPPTALHA
jgi:hypothetical protein